VAASREGCDLRDRQLLLEVFIKSVVQELSRIDDTLRLRLRELP
jgi:hypothetical protein